jgi:hypothetical protein
VGQVISFQLEFNEAIKEKAVRIECQHEVVGYVNRGLKNTFIAWLENGRVENAFVEKINGTSQRPALYVFVKITGKSTADF